MQTNTLLSFGYGLLGGFAWYFIGLLIWGKRLDIRKAILLNTLLATFFFYQMVQLEQLDLIPSICFLVMLVPALDIMLVAFHQAAQNRNNKKT